MSIPSNIQQAVPFFLVSDMARSLEFYVGKLGFTKTRDWKPKGKIEWCWLERDQIALMLQEPRSPVLFETANSVGGGFSICFQCIDALLLYHEFSAKGVEISEPFVGNNRWVVAFRDPDGYKLDFESGTEVAEETSLSEWNKRKTV